MARSALEVLEEARKQKSVAQQLLDKSRGIDAAPFQLPPDRPRIIQPTEFEPPIELTPERFSPEEQALAGQGVDITSGSPVGRFASGFAQNPALQAEDLKGRLAEHFGQEVQVQMGSQGLEFINPQNDRRTLVDEVTLSGGDIADLVGPAIPAVLGAAGAVAGPFTAAAGAGIGETIRRGVGEGIGVRDETQEQFTKGVAGVAATEGVLTKAGDVGLAAIQRTRNFLRPPALKPDAAARALSALEADQAIADQIAKQTGKPFQPFTGQLSGDPTLLGGQASVLSSPQTAVPIRNQLRQNETTLESFFDDLNPQASGPNTVTGRAVQVEARGQTQPRVEAAKTNLAQQTEELERLTAAIPQGQNSAIINELGEQAAAGRAVLKRSEDDAWNLAREQMGFNPDTALSDIKVPIDGDLAVTLRRLQRESIEAIDPATATGKAALIPEGLTGDSVDLNQMQVHLSSLRRRRRLSQKGEVATDPQGRDIGRIERELVAKRNAFLKETNPELLKAIEEAEGLTAIRAQSFDKGLLSQVLRKEGGEWQLTDSELIGRVLGSGDKESMEHLVSVLGGHPAGVPTLKRSFLQFYRNEVVRDGLPDAALHKRFLERHSESVDTLFPKQSQIRQLGEFEKVVTNQIDRFKRFEAAVESSFRGKIQNIAPERIAEDVLSKRFSVKEMSRLMSLAEAAGVKTQYQNAITDQIRRRFLSPTSGLNLNAMDKFVGGNQERLIAALGGRYVRDMGLLLKGLKTIRTSPGGIGTTRNPTLLGSIVEGVARATVARPLSPTGVSLTRALNFRERAAQRMMAAAISNPDALRAIVLNGQKDIRNKTVARILAAFGGSSLALDINEGE